MDSKKAVFLDRDGVINEDFGHIRLPEQVKLIKGSAKAIAMLNKEYPVIIITNQAAVARGMCTEEDARKVNDKVLELLAEEGAKIDATYMCFHHPEYGIGSYKVDCSCRKPKPGMILEAAKAFGIGIRNSYMVGDKASDIKAGKAAGARTILVKTGYGEEHEKPDFIAKDLYEAAKIIMSENK